VLVNVAHLVRFLNGRSSFSRHLWFDERGQGSSDPIPLVEGRLTESVVDDMITVLDDLGATGHSLYRTGVPSGAPRQGSAR
jgi:hypothetical protein